MSCQSIKAKNWLDLQQNGQINSAAGWSMQGISDDRGQTDKPGLGDISDYFFLDLAEGLANFPEGDDCGMLTVVIKHALQHRHCHAKHSDIATYIQQWGLYAPQLPGSVTNADTAALRRHFPPAGEASSGVQIWWKAGGFVHD